MLFASSKFNVQKYHIKDSKFKWHFETWCFLFLVIYLYMISYNPKKEITWNHKQSLYKNNIYIYI
jgi:hypothetical protein